MRDDHLTPEALKAEQALVQEVAALAAQHAPTAVETISKMGDAISGFLQLADLEGNITHTFATIKKTPEYQALIQALLVGCVFMENHLNPITYDVSKDSNHDPVGNASLD